MLVLRKMFRNLNKIHTIKNKMKTQFIDTTQIRVRYSETDQMGYCYYGNYASFFEVGRVEALRKIGLSYRELEESGVMLPVSHFEVDYKHPALYDDELTISTAIVELKGAQLFFEYSIKNEKGILIALAKTTLVFVAKITMRPISPPQEFVDLVHAYRIEE